MIGKKITIQTYKDFLKKIYKDENTRAAKINVISLVTTKAFKTNSDQEFIGIYQGENLLCTALAIIHKNNKNQLILGFFEALPKAQKAVDTLIQYSENLGKSQGVTKIIIGMDGHCNNGLGFPLNQSKSTFGEASSPSYYHEYFKDFDKVKLVSFGGNAQNIRQKLSKDMEILKDKTSITLELSELSPKGFKTTMKKYTDLNNSIFNNHKYYFKREYQEDYQLFKEMLPLLKNENLIFAKSKGEYIGFILWYPDFNELAGEKAVGAKTYIKYKILGQKISKVKVVEIGVLPEFQNSGAIIMLLDKSLKTTGKHGQEVVSSWILEENRSSVLITKRYCKNSYKGYYYYERNI